MEIDWDILLDAAVLLFIVIALLIKTLALRRTTSLGVAIARFNTIFFFVYLVALLDLFADLPWVKGEWYRIGIRTGILITSALVVHELHKAYGGWKPLLYEAWLGVPGVRRRLNNKTVPKAIKHLDQPH